MVPYILAGCAVLTVLASAVAAFVSMKTAVAVARLELRIVERLDKYATKDDLQHCQNAHAAAGQNWQAPTPKAQPWRPNNNATGHAHS